MPIYDAATRLIEVSRVVQFTEGSKIQSRRVVARELGTVQIRGPRHIGHTTAAFKIGKEIFEGLAILVVPNSPAAVQAAEEANDGAFVRITEPGATSKILGLTIRAVVVDGASRLTPDETEWIYSDELLACFDISRGLLHYVLLG